MILKLEQGIQYSVSGVGLLWGQAWGLSISCFPFHPGLLWLLASYPYSSPLSPPLFLSLLLVICLCGCLWPRGLLIYHSLCADTHVAQQLRGFSYWTFDIYGQTPHTTVAGDQVLIPTLLWTLEIGPKENPLSFWNIRVLMWKGTE